MKQRVTYKTSDGTLKEQFFDDFNEFADSMESVAQQYYQGLQTPQVKVDTINKDGLIRNESITNSEPTDFDRPSFLSENG